jgi:hypothetical protein
MKQQYQFTDPPQALRKAKLDNIVLVPASVLPFKPRYQKIANSLPMGSVLICHSFKNTGQQKLLETVGAFFQKRGRRVTMFSTEGIV